MTGKGVRDGFSIGSDCNGCADFSGSNGYGIWATRGMALAGHCPRNRRHFSQQKELGCVDDDRHWSLYLGCKILFYTSFDPCGHPDVFSPNRSDHYRPLLDVET